MAKLHTKLIGAALGIGLAFTTSGCSTTLGQTFESVLGFNTTQVTLKSTAYALTVYTHAYQPALITYGNLPPCAANANTSLATASICHVPSLFAKLKGYDAAVNTVAQSGRKVLEGSVTDPTMLQTIMDAITTAEGGIKGAGIAVPNYTPPSNS